jgi:hypothetical protein
MRDARQVHYTVDSEHPVCRSGGYCLVLTHIPKKVTCLRCKDHPHYKEMMEEGIL